MSATTKYTKMLPKNLAVAENKKHVKKTKRTHEQYIEELKIANPDIEPIQNYVDSKTPILHRCKIHNYIYKSYPLNVLRGTKCKICRSDYNSKKFLKTNKQFVEELYSKNPYIILINEYNGVRKPIKCLCLLCNNTFSILPDTLLKKNGIGCPKCREQKAISKKRLTIDLYKKRVNDINPNIEVLDSKYINNNIKIKHRCKICNNIFYAMPANILKGHGCRKCADKLLSNILKKTDKDFIADFIKNNSNANDILILSKYTGSHDILYCKCKICNNMWTSIATNLLKGSGCPFCKSSIGEKIINEYFINKNIFFESQKKFNSLCGVNNGLLSYDFYLPNYNLLIEFQGNQHEKPIEYFGGKKQFIKQQIHDIRKRRYAKEHNIKLVTIWYDQINKIPEILNNYLNNLKLESVTTTGVA